MRVEDGVMEWWSGGVVEWWSGGVVEWWSGGVVEWWSGGVVDLNRLVRQVEDMALYVDFLTELPSATTGTRTVDDVIASVVPGINRALESRRMMKIEGRDIYGVKQTCELAVSDIGPLLVLKLNAFGGPTGRRHPKDAYDILLAITSFVDGPQAALDAFQAEGTKGNTGFASAVEALRQDFGSVDSDAPVRAAEFLRGTFDAQMRVREELVTFRPKTKTRASDAQNLNAPRPESGRGGA